MNGHSARLWIVRASWMVLSVAAFTGEGAAQSDKPNAESHDGPWFSIGGGLGGVSIPRGLGVFGYSVHLAGGVSPHERLLLGVELDAIKAWDWMRTSPGPTYHFVTAGVRLYPSDTAGFWLRLGAGPYSLSGQRNGFRTKGALAALGAGYDLGITKTMSSHIEFTWLVAVTGRGEIFDEPAQIRPQSKSLRMGITMH